MKKWLLYFFVSLVFGGSGGFLSLSQAQPYFSAFAVDAHTGRILFEKEANALRYPASLTKMMTLYLIFQDLETHRISLETRIRISAYSASRPPSRLGLKPGETVRVEEAIKALIVKSANDVAVAMAENLEGSEEAFARRMTKTARSLGMKNTTFRNASGLPHPDQLTTAYDMAVLGLRLQRDFPRYYGYFRLLSFQYRQKTIQTHNHLLKKMPGVDGIKTGYTAASGFNLVTSLDRDQKKLVGVVFGGQTSQARNTYMKKMLEETLKNAQPGRGVVPRPQEGGGQGISGSVAPSGGEGKKSDSLFMIRNKQAEITGVKIKAHRSRSLRKDRVRRDPTPLPFQKIAKAEQQKPEVPSPSALWAIQIGAFPLKGNAEKKLQEARHEAQAALQGKQSHIVDFKLKHRKMYRARFLGFQTMREAVTVCKHLKKKHMSCLVFQDNH